MTRYVSEAELNANLAKVLDEVQLEGDAVIVTRPNGERVIVQRLPNPDEMDTTEYLLNNPVNARGADGVDGRA